MSLTFKSLDNMKASRDQNPPWSNALIVEHVNAINLLVPDLTHMTVDCYANNFGYHSVAHVKQWFDAIHAVGKKVFFRPAWVGLGVNAAGIAKFVQAVSDFQDCWQDGDWWDIAPESSPGNALWNQWARDSMLEVQAAFDTIGKNVNTDLWSVTDQNVIFNKRITDETVTAFGNKVCVDFYPMDAGSLRVKIQNFMGQLNLMHLNYPTADIYVTEIGYNNTVAITDYDQRNLLHHWLNELSNLSYVKGLNYWVAYGNAQFDKTMLFQSQSRTIPRGALYSLSDFYKNGLSQSRMRNNI